MNLNFAQEENKVQFSRPNQAENYLKYRPSYPREFLDAHIKPAMEEYLKESETVNAIDLACGSGQLTFKIFDYFDKILGIDFAPKTLEVAREFGKEKISAGRLDLMEYNCSKVEEILELPEVKKLNPKLILIGEAFHWFNCKQFLQNFVEKNKEKGLTLILTGYHIHFQVLPESDSIGHLFNNFMNLIKPYYRFNYETLKSSYQDLELESYFRNSSLTHYDEEIKDCPISHYLGYLDTLSAYRNYLEAINHDPAKDPLIALMRDLGLKNFEDKKFDLLEYPKDVPNTINYKNTYFMWVLK